MIFPMGSIFIFGSWVCKADDNGNLHGHLVEDLEAHEDLTLSMKLTEDLEKFTLSKSNRAPIMINLDLTSESDSSSESYLGSFKDESSPFLIGLQNTALTLEEIHLNLLQVSSKKSSRFSTGLNNMTKTYQGFLRSMAGRARRLHLTGAQEDIVLTIISKDCLVHWSGTCP
jgi:hypothetical protein